jgi:hypothetical protein
LLESYSFAPDESGKPGLKSLFFLGRKERPAWSSFCDFRKKGFERGLATNSWTRL